MIKELVTYNFNSIIPQITNIFVFLDFKNPV